jgi:F-type H+-transporting ATPase subunit b
MRFIRSCLPLVAALAVVVLLAEPALAADAHGGDKKEGGILDKLSFTGIKRYDLGIYTLLVFGLLLFVLNKHAWPKISAGLKKREASIIGARDEAGKALRDAEELRARLHKDLAETQLKIRDMLDEARRDADALRAQEREAGAREAAAERDRARREIEGARDIALDEIYKQAVDLATTLSAKTLSRQISAEDHRRLLDESLAELGLATKGHA